MKKQSTLIFLLFSLVYVSYSQTVKIGNQVWMTKNLDVSKFRNGDPIPQCKTDEQWKNAGYNKQPAWCYYNNDPANGEKYGKLYNWYAVSDSRGLVPIGWHVPSDEEWTILENYLGGNVEKKLKSNSGWRGKGNGTNESGFKALPGGRRGIEGAFDKPLGEYGCWWSSTMSYENEVWGRNLSINYNFLDRDDYHNERGMSVRCVKD